MWQLPPHRLSHPRCVLPTAQCPGMCAPAWLWQAQACSSAAVKASACPAAGCAAASRQGFSLRCQDELCCHLQPVRHLHHLHHHSTAVPTLAPRKAGKGLPDCRAMLATAAASVQPGTEWSISPVRPSAAPFCRAATWMPAQAGLWQPPAHREVAAQWPR